MGLKIKLAPGGRKPCVRARKLLPCCGQTGTAKCCELGLGYKCGWILNGANLNTSTVVSFSGTIHSPQFSVGSGPFAQTFPTTDISLAMSCASPFSPPYSTVGCLPALLSTFRVVRFWGGYDITSQSNGTATATINATPGFDYADGTQSVTIRTVRGSVGVNSYADDGSQDGLFIAIPGYPAVFHARVSAMITVQSIVLATPNGVIALDNTLYLLVGIDDNGVVQASGAGSMGPASTFAISATPVYAGSCMTGMTFSINCSVRAAGSNQPAVTYAGSGSVSATGLGGCGPPPFIPVDGEDPVIRFNHVVRNLT